MAQLIVLNMQQNNSILHLRDCFLKQIDLRCAEIFGSTDLDVGVSADGTARITPLGYLNFFKNLQSFCEKNIIQLKLLQEQSEKKEDKLQ